MATKTFEELKQLAIQIRDEKTNKQNTATRIGTQMLEHLDKLEQDYYDKTATDEELQARDEKLTELEDKQGIYNVDNNKPLETGFYTSTTARSAVPVSIRKINLVITYKTDDTTCITEQFIGSSVSDWYTENNWKSVGSEGGNKIISWKTDVATTRKQVPLKERKNGMQISYTSDGEKWTNEQYIGTSTIDTEWEKDSNWEKIANLSDLLDVQEKLINSVAHSTRNIVFSDEFEKKGTYSVANNNATIALSNTLGGSWINKYAIPEGSCIKITAKNSSSLIMFLKDNDISVTYGFNFVTNGLLCEGETGTREVNAGESLDYTTIEPTYIYVVPGADNEKIPSIYIDILGLENKIKEVDDKLPEMQEQIDSNTTILNNSLDKVEASIGLEDFNGTDGNDDNGTYKSVTGEINVYSTSSVGLECTNPRNLLSQGHKYSVFAKVLITSADNNTDYNVTIDVSSVINISNSAKLENVQLEKLHYLKIGEFEWGGTYSSSIKIGIGILKNIDTPVVDKKSVTCKYYGVYIVDSEKIPENIQLEYLLNYIKKTTYITDVSQRSQLSAKSLDSEHASSSENAKVAEKSNKLNTILDGKIIGVYGDSLVTYINWIPLGEYFNATAKMVGQGGGQICNNRSDVKQGFCTLERCALLPKQMALLIIYAGANDAISKRNPSTHQLEVDEDLLGSIEDKPLNIADMCNYRVTSSNMATIDTAGRTGRFYQGIKTMLRNIIILFPNTQIIVATQHRYYNYINHDSDSFTDYPVLNFGNDIKRKALIEVAEEFGIPVCDLWSTCGVNDYNLRNTLVDLAGVAVHPNTGLSQRECSMFINSILINSNKISVEKYSPYPNYTSTNKYTQEMQEWVVDLRNEESVTPMSLTEAISQFQSTCQTNSIEIKNNMYLVFEDDKSTSVGYFLTDKGNISSESSWEKWELQDINDPNEG